MNWYEYLPAVISIYLIVISRFSSRYLRNSVDRLLSLDSVLSSHSYFIQNVALDWANRLGFITSMCISLISVFAIYANTQNYGYAVGTFIVLLIIFIPMLFWVLSFLPGDLVASRVGRTNITPETVCNSTLVLVNVVLIAAIYITQATTASP